MDSPSSPTTDKSDAEAFDSFTVEAEKLKTAVKEEAGETAVKIKEEAKVAVSHLKEAGLRYAENQKEALSGKAGEYASAVSALCEKLSNTAEPNLLLGPAQSAAGQLKSLSQYLKESDPAEILRGVERMAKQKPELFFGGLFLAGLLTSRFLKASGTRATEQARIGARKHMPAAVRDSSAASTTYFNPSNE